MGSKPGIFQQEEDAQNAALRSTLRKLRLQLRECRRGGGSRSHHRMEVERLMEDLVGMLDEYHWASEMARRLRQLHRRVHINGLSTSNCQDLEILMERLRRFERAQCGGESGERVNI